MLFSHSIILSKRGLYQIVTKPIVHLKEKRLLILLKNTQCKVPLQTELYFEELLVAFTTPILVQLYNYQKF